jgi:hypothetical protein
MGVAAELKSAGRCVYATEVNYATLGKHSQKYKVSTDNLQHANDLQLRFSGI